MIVSRKTAYKILIATFVVLSAFLTAFGQETAPLPKVEQKIGSIRFSSQVEINKKTEVVARKRFYLIRGNLEDNKALLEEIAKTTAKSANCYYADLRRENPNLSPAFFCWLKNKDCTKGYCRCESVYCRDITMDDVGTVPEFAAAYRQSLKEYRQQPVLALKWLTTNLPSDIRDGFYRQQEAAIDNLVKLAQKAAQEATRTAKENLVVFDEDVQPDMTNQIICSDKLKPAGRTKSKADQSMKQPKIVACKDFQSVVTDRQGNAYFLDIDLVIPQQIDKKMPEGGKKPRETETYLITNLAPVVFGDTSFIWTCEVEIKPADAANPQRINLKNEINKNNKCKIVPKPISENCNFPECGNTPPEKQAVSN